jgi:hypothetical protein
MVRRPRAPPVVPLNRAAAVAMREEATYRKVPNPAGTKPERAHRDRTDVDITAPPNMEISR